MRFNTQLQTNIIPGEAFAAPGTDAPDRPVQFGTRFNNLLGLQVEQNLYNPTQRVDRQLAEQQKTVAEANYVYQATEIKLAITEAYLAVLLLEERCRLAQDNMQRSESYYNIVKNRYDNGTILRSELDRYYLDWANAQSRYETDQRDLKIRQAYLSNQLGLSVSQTLRLTEDLQELAGTGPETQATPGNFAQRIELRQEAAQLKLNEVNYERQNKAYLPTISLYGNLSTQQLTNDVPLFEASAWSSFHYVGLRSQINLFDGFLREKNKEEFRLRQQINRNNLAKLELDLNYERQSAGTDLIKTQENYKLARQNLDLARRVAEEDQLKFQEGSLTSADLHNTEYALREAQNNLLNNLYDYLLAKVRWEKAQGRL
ncbi:MAG: TolC family protein [Bacteroidia bacterium]|nr:TolC family protein [Bacteroidia bacterium]